MGTTKVKVIDLSSDQQEVKTSRKSASAIKPSVDIEAKKASKMRPSINTEETPVAEVKKRVPIATDEVPSKKPEPTKAAREAPVYVKQKPHGVKYQKARQSTDSAKVYPIKEAIDLVGKTSYTKFDPSVEAHINVNQKNVRGQVSFPHTTGPKKEKRYLVFSAKLKSSDDKNLILAGDSTIDDLVSGKLKPGKDFEGVIASPKYMPQMARVAKILGPVGMMPNPKNGTITDDPQSLISSGQTDAVEFRSDPMAPIVHMKIGKLSNKQEELEENLKALINAVGQTKVKSITVTSTMGPGIKIDVS